MPIKINGPGKYDDLCTYVCTHASARGAIILVIDGDKGAGFSVQAEADILLRLPELLETMAQDIRRQLASDGDATADA